MQTNFERITVPTPVGEWHMVACAKCKMLVGWTRQPMTRNFYCIQDFDQVAHQPEDAT